jgi:DNA sulfur modification protein DndE
MTSPKPPSVIRLSMGERNQLLTLKRRTNAPTWAVLCRFAFTASLAERRPPAAQVLPGDGLEIAWHTFAGRYEELYWGLLVERVRRDGLPLDEPTLHQQLRAHLHRGIGLLIADRRIHDSAGLLRSVLGEARP